MSEEKVWTNSGRAFSNSDKKTERHADFRGEGEVTCPHCRRRTLFFVDAWNKMSAKGAWLSFSFKPKDKQPDGEAPSSSPRSDVKKFSDSMDFDGTGGPPQRQRSITDEDIPF